MREIKFRLWNQSAKVMSLNVGYHPHEAVNRSADPDQNDHYTSMTVEGAITHSPFMSGILMQFTGLKDSKGVDIYDGDILSWDYSGETEWKAWMDEPIYKVVFEDGYIVCGKGLKKGLYLHGFRFKHTKVIGNIHQNPELL